MITKSGFCEKTIRTIGLIGILAVTSPSFSTTTLDNLILQPEAYAKEYKTENASKRSLSKSGINRAVRIIKKHAKGECYDGFNNRYFFNLVTLKEGDNVWSYELLSDGKHPKGITVKFYGEGRKYLELVDNGPNGVLNRHYGTSADWEVLNKPKSYFQENYIDAILLLLRKY
jgi:hypothetical protein